MSGEYAQAAVLSPTSRGALVMSAHCRSYFRRNKGEPMSKLSRRQALKAVAAAGAVTGCLPSSRTKEARAACRTRTRRKPTRSSRSRRRASPGRRSIRSCSACTTTTTTRGQRAPGPGRVAGRPQPRPGLRGQGRLAHVPRRDRPRLPAAPAPRLRDRHHRAPRAARSLRLAGRDRALRPRRRAVADRRPRHRARRDVPAARARARQPASSCSRSG